MIEAMKSIVDQSKPGESLEESAARIEEEQWPFLVARWTWAIEPDAMGFRSKESK